MCSKRDYCIYTYYIYFKQPGKTDAASNRIDDDDNNMYQTKGEYDWNWIRVHRSGKIC